jgi:hypothetical protein
MLVGVLWTLFHLQLYAGGALFMAVLAAGFVAMSVMMQALLADFEFNVLGSALYHLGINLGGLLSFGLITEFNLGFVAIYSGIAVFVATATVYALRRRSGQNDQSAGDRRALKP